MKLFIILLLVFCSTAASANFDSAARSKTIVNASALLMAVDWLQTLDIERHPGDPLNYPYTKPLHETNPILGRHPTRQTINLYFVSKLAFHFWINNSNTTLSKKVQPYWNVFSVVDSSYHVQRNYELGLEVKF